MEVICETKKAICVFGGGLRSMAGASALISIALAADPKLKGGGEYPKKASTERCINDAMYNLFSNFPMITSSSGGSWFVYCLLTSTRFNDVIMKMALRYLMRNFDIENIDKENPFHVEFLQKSLNLAAQWNREYLETEKTKLGKIVGGLNDRIFEKVVPKVGGDLYLLLKFAFTEKDIWNSFIEILLSSMITYSSVPEWYTEVSSLDWFMTVTVNLPRTGPYMISESELTDLISSSGNKRKVDLLDPTQSVGHGSLIRSIPAQQLCLKYVVEASPEMIQEGPFRGFPNYKKYQEDRYGRVDLIPGCYKISNEKSDAKPYVFTSDSLGDLKIIYYFSDKPGVPISPDHITDVTINTTNAFNNMIPIHIKRSKPNLHFSSSEKIVELKRFIDRNCFLESTETSISDCVSIPVSKSLLDETLYRVSASSAAGGTTASMNVDYVTGGSKRASGGNLTTGIVDTVSKDRNFMGILEDMDILLLFGDQSKIESVYEMLFQRSVHSDRLDWWSLRGEQFCECLDELLAKGELISNNPSCEQNSGPTRSSTNSKPVIMVLGHSILKRSGKIAKMGGQKIRETAFHAKSLPTTSTSQMKINKISLEDYASLVPLNILDGGNTDNTGVSRAVMEGATHLSILAFGLLDFAGLFENNGIEVKSANMCVYSEIFKCSKREQEYLKMITYQNELTNSMSDAEIKQFIENDVSMSPGIEPNFVFVCRKTYHQSLEQQKYLNKMFVCKFQDLKVNPHPHYFNCTENQNRVVKDLSIAFGIPQDYGLQRGALENDFSNYGPFCDEIFAAIQNGFEDEFTSKQSINRSRVQNNENRATAFRQFIF